jgi:hypothetical protein
MLRNEQGYAYERPSLTRIKLRRLELRGGAPALTGERPPVESVRPSGSTRPRRNAPPSGPCSSKRKRPICASSATRGQRAILILLALVAIGASFYLSLLLTIASNSRGAPSDAGIREPAARRVR